MLFGGLFILCWVIEGYLVLYVDLWVGGFGWCWILFIIVLCFFCLGRIEWLNIK